MFFKVFKSTAPKRGTRIIPATSIGMAMTAAILAYQKQQAKYLELVEKRKIKMLEKSGEPLSGIFIESRPTALPLPSYLFWVNQFFPCHVSFIIPDPQGKARHVGIGSILDETSFKGPFRLAMTQWRHHEGPKYMHTKPGKYVPIEAWGLFYQTFGCFPVITNLEELRKRTKTPDEYADGHQQDGLQGYFLLPTKIPPHKNAFFLGWQPALHHCQTAALKVAYEASHHT